MSATLIITGTARTISRQLAAVQRLGLVPSGPRIVAATEEDHEVDNSTSSHGGRLPQIVPAANSGRAG